MLSLSPGQPFTHPQNVIGAEKRSSLAERAVGAARLGDDPGVSWDLPIAE
jgi:hypothetical protein